jgi:DNA-binding CsgD family transcriptional regulator
LLLVTLDGRIRFATGRASLWLDAYFAKRPDAAFLPEPLCRWLTEEDSAATSFRSASGETELEIAIVRSDADGAFCLVLNEKSVRKAALHAALSALTAREQDVLGWVAEGKSNADIAAVLDIEVATVKKHLQNIFIKLGVHSRMAAAGFVFSNTEQAARRSPQLRFASNAIAGSARHLRVVPAAER